MKVEVRISGLGGQGVILAGQILGRAAVYDGKNAVQTQSYGAEARGSAAKSEVIISDDKIGFPVVRKCDILVAMSQEAVDRNLKELKENGFVLIDSSTVKKVPKIKAEIFKIRATEIAQKTFSAKIYANMIMLGAFTTLTRIISKEAMIKAIKEIVPTKIVDIDLQAYKKGLTLTL
ncbi:2-oxoacid:ferredoxin oxidoreductase subunit gamma [Candidatus Bathyarchaeota archaeon]|nr:2-oxoacid:acceptor oxidoreductase family protein [Candidatus Bathyarchaeota archaeon]RLI10037.1 MAG: 2-oxoacid:ferredoxin oxidoreductase subunit gamma [Candidatus Bathyarchaeota archaeon]RLI14459.1 MAG: 2-oxoacid:ferredoxin oxidoreductase subunit gamma [Candidatus Bathyarchaeota archaeon]RLI22819.1 MAG: 2-oxoacid:ferredoxin oxidoreductase subunit gamma [Candidatus Bathyarchaeota archaeon]